MTTQVHVFYGSQSGTAECFAQEIAEEASKYDIVAEAIDLTAFSPQAMSSCKIIIMVVSTYGDGEPSENAQAFHAWAEQPRNDGSLKGSRFTVMGLGDMNYSQFNNMGKMTDVNLTRLGSKQIYKRGVGDDSQDIDLDFKTWKEGGLWEALQKAVAAVNNEGGFAAYDPSAEAVSAFAVTPEINLLFANEECIGAAQDICEELSVKLRSKGCEITTTQSLSDRKAVEAVRKLNKCALAVVIADVNPEGMCSAARKLVRNMNLEMEPNQLKEKDLKLCMLTVASSKCSNSAGALKGQLEQASVPMLKAFLRAGSSEAAQKMPKFVDAGVDDVAATVEALCQGIMEAAQPITQGAAAAPAAAATTETAAEPSNGYPAEAAPAAAAAPAITAKIISTGPEAKEASEALAGAWSGGIPIEDASLAALASAAQQKFKVVLSVECATDGSLSDGSRALAAQLRGAPMALKVQLRQLRYFLLAIAVTDYGNAGERAAERGRQTEQTAAVAPIKEALAAIGAVCAGEASMDLQDADDAVLAGHCGTIRSSFDGGAAPAQAPAQAVMAPAAAAPKEEPKFGTPELKMAVDAASLPAEVPGEPSDVLARFYFEAQKAKIAASKQLRQAPKAEEGLSTVEIEIEASGSLKEYTLGGTLTLLPENDPAVVTATLPLLGLQESDLSKMVTFVPADGTGNKVKRPFPTPCTIREALTRYCDLGRAPNKKMLQSLQPKLEDQGARERLAAVIEDAEAVKLMAAGPSCCKMFEFWRLLDVKKINLGDFLLSCPRQKPREFTIASSPKAQPDRITLCVSLTSHELPALEPLAERLQAVAKIPASPASGRGRFFGIASRWVCSQLKVGDCVLAKARSSAFHLPEKDVPVIMVGAGAGVAPFRGFWKEMQKGTQKAPAALFFGCRHPEQDWLYKEEMSTAVKLGGSTGLSRVQVGPKRPLAGLYTAFSRPGDDKKSQYVQDQLRAQKTSVKHWIEKMDGVFYICGSSAMGNAVLDALGDTLEGGKAKVDELRKENRIIAEMWG